MAKYKNKQQQPDKQLKELLEELKPFLRPEEEIPQQPEERSGEANNVPHNLRELHALLNS